MNTLFDTTNEKMFSSKICAKRKLQIFLKCLLVILIFGIYFIVLLRESITALEVSNRQANYLELKQTHPINRKHQWKHHRFQSAAAINKTLAAVVHKKEIGLTTINPVYEYLEEQNAAAERDFAERKNRLANVCMKNDWIDQSQPNAWEFFISPGHGVAWCNVFKAASSTWMYYFNILGILLYFAPVSGGYDIKFLQRTRTSPLELARKKFPRPTLNELTEALSTSLSFLIVREPFERLLSAYRNKLEGYRNRYYKILGEQIVKKFRKSPKKSVSGPTFKEFLLFLIKNHKAGERFDEHWSPIYTFCTPCSINFTLIAKVETFKRDSEYIIRQAGLETLLLNKLPAKKIKSITNQSSSETRNYVAKYFSQIDINTLNELLEVYGPDFELFGYDSAKYFDIVQPSSLTAKNVSTKVT